VKIFAAALALSSLVAWSAYAEDTRTKKDTHMVVPALENYKETTLLGGVPAYHRVTAASSR
jgi:hypothetical protein